MCARTTSHSPREAISTPRDRCLDPEETEGKRERERESRMCLLLLARIRKPDDKNYTALFPDKNRELPKQMTRRRSRQCKEGFERARCEFAYCFTVKKKKKKSLRSKRQVTFSKTN